MNTSRGTWPQTLLFLLCLNPPRPRPTLPIPTEVVAACAATSGADAVSLVPRELCEDSSPVLPVLQFALSDLEPRSSSPFTEFAYLRATSPLVESRQLAGAMQMFREHAQPAESAAIDSVLGVVEVTGAHPSRFLRKDRETGLLTPAFPDAGLAPPQRDPEAAAAEQGHPGQSSSSLRALRRSGGVCVTTPEMIRSGSIWGQKAVPFLMSEETAVDINSEVDAILAEALLQRRRNREDSRRASVGQCDIQRNGQGRRVFP